MTPKTNTGKLSAASTPCQSVVSTRYDRDLLDWAKRQAGVSKDAEFLRVALDEKIGAILDGLRQAA